jgi:hypothetical protein
MTGWASAAAQSLLSSQNRKTVDRSRQ